jgi:hypothetical protein
VGFLSISCEREVTVDVHGAHRVLTGWAVIVRA